MPLNHEQDGKRSTLATAGLVLLPLLCCGLPLLLVAGALGATGSVLGNPWLIGTAAATLLGVLIWRMRCSVAESAMENTGDCCPPKPPNERNGQKQHE